MLTAALAIAGAPAVPALLFGTTHGPGALMLAAALSGLFTCAAFATSFAFGDAPGAAKALSGPLPRVCSHGRTWPMGGAYARDPTNP